MVVQVLRSTHRRRTGTTPDPLFFGEFYRDPQYLGGFRLGARLRGRLPRRALRGRVRTDVEDQYIRTRWLRETRAEMN
ncbi:hypothetical protein GCM10011588_72310 [Nocardia jinanensis]|uniref:Uncharacterized protein n=1 Tax=Nocardia jinanensis TaxID=382504 RepID=A0A917W0N7_9NOCA|nr:hypothetical protein GCM10011588_72310 [Nocardia jinanensis]